MFRILLLLAVAVVAYLLLFRPRALFHMGRKARVVAYAYVAAILISAFIRLTFGWGE
jgi:hypothetical protein